MRELRREGVDFTAVKETVSCPSGAAVKAKKPTARSARSPALSTSGAPPLWSVALC